MDLKKKGTAVVPDGTQVEQLPALHGPGPAPARIAPGDREIPEKTQNPWYFQLGCFIISYKKLICAFDFPTGPGHLAWQKSGHRVLGRTSLIFLEKIAENRILAGIRDGLFDNLEGQGQPLVLEDDSHVPPELRMAFKILKMADCLPPELELQKQIVCLQDMLAGLPDEAAKLQQLRRLNFLTMKLNMLRKVSPLLQEHNDYSAKILEKLDRLPQAGK
jgi:hypothetical protein